MYHSRPAGLFSPKKRRALLEASNHITGCTLARFARVITLTVH
ncbi:hypothetical protein SAMN05660479_02565 [Microbulbifer thermotolerans]|nr:hypothetical protein SAMN05660479_02565 [Microbulbifer thermotolerans]